MAYGVAGIQERLANKNSPYFDKQGNLKEGYSLEGGPGYIATGTAETRSYSGAGRDGLKLNKGSQTVYQKSDVEKDNTNSDREYGIKGSFDQDSINEFLATTRSRVDDILSQSSNESRRDAVIRRSRENIQEDLAALTENIGDPMDREAGRDRANPRFDPYDAERRQRLLNDYEQMAQQNRAAYDKKTAGIGQSGGSQRESLVQLAGRYGAGPLFGHKPYQQARERGYSDSEILKFLEENPQYQATDMYNELKSGNINVANIASNADRGPAGFKNIIGMM